MCFGKRKENVSLPQIVQQPTVIHPGDACWACVRFKRRKIQLGMRANLQFDNFYLHQKRKMLSVSTREPVKVAQTKNS